MKFFATSLSILFLTETATAKDTVSIELRKTFGPSKYLQFDKHSLKQSNEDDEDIEDEVDVDLIVPSQVQPYKWPLFEGTLSLGS